MQDSQQYSWKHLRDAASFPGGSCLLQLLSPYYRRAIQSNTLCLTLKIKPTTNHPWILLKFHRIIEEISLRGALRNHLVPCPAGLTSSRLGLLGACSSWGSEERHGLWPARLRRTGSRAFPENVCLGRSENKKWDGVQHFQREVGWQRTTAPKVRISAPKFNPRPALVAQLPFLDQALGSSACFTNRNFAKNK